MREARIEGAKELNKALGRVHSGEGEGLKEFLALLDQILANWTD